MELATALTVFQKLEDETRAETVGDEGESWYEVPTYKVRLDAGTDQDEKRTIRIRAVVNTPYADDDDTQGPLLALCLLAEEHTLAMRVDNNGIELT